MEQAFRRAEQIEQAAFEDMIEGAPRALRAAIGIGLERFDGVVVAHARRVPDVVFNRVLGLGICRPATEAVVDRALGTLRREGIERFVVHVHPEAEPAELGAMLRARGLVPFRRHWVKFLRGPDPAPSVETPLSIAEAGPRHAAAVAHVVSRAFGLAPAVVPFLAALVGREGWHVLAAFDGDEPVAAGGMFVRDRTAWLGFGATLPSHRGLRAQSALLARRIDAAVERGCDLIATETGEAVPGEPQTSYHNIERSGFRPAYVRANYVNRSSATGAARW